MSTVNDYRDEAIFDGYDVIDGIFCNRSIYEKRCNGYSDFYIFFEPVELRGNNLEASRESHLRYLYNSGELTFTFDSIRLLDAYKNRKKNAREIDIEVESSLRGQTTFDGEFAFFYKFASDYAERVIRDRQLPPCLFEKVRKFYLNELQRHFRTPFETHHINFKSDGTITKIDGVAVKSRKGRKRN